MTGLEALLSGYLPGVSFAAQWVLTGLIVLPLLWWLLRLSPPPSRNIRFPAFHFIRDLSAKSQTTATSPIWLLLLRSLIILLVLLALAGPTINSDRQKQNSAPLIVLLDDSWPAAQDWSERIDFLDKLLARTAADGRLANLMLTAGTPAEAENEFDLIPAQQLRSRIQSLKPKAWNKDLTRILEKLNGSVLPAQAEVIWIHDGLSDDQTNKLSQRLQSLGSLTVVSVPDRFLVGLSDIAASRKTDQDTSTLFRVVRPKGQKGEISIVAKLVAEDGRALSRTSGKMSSNSSEALLKFDLPLALRNEAQSVKLEDQNHAGSLYILDASWQRPIVGLAQINESSETRTLLDGAYYLQKALATKAEVIEGPLSQHLAGNTDLILLDDEGKIADQEKNQLRQWIDSGGILLRFAGPRLIAGASDSGAGMLLPAPLRRGGRSLTGALTWTKPLSIGTFNASSPLADLTPASDTLVRKQVLTEPGAIDDKNIWARLTDGTPLITARQMGKGRVILIHTGASPSWSDLPFSGMFVQILERLAHFATNSGVPITRGDIDTAVDLIQQQEITAFGDLNQVENQSIPVTWPAGRELRASAMLPPGVYKAGAGAGARVVNLLGSDDTIETETSWPNGVIHAKLDDQLELPLTGWFLAAAMMLFFIDTLVILVHKGLLPVRPIPSVSAVILMLFFFNPDTASAQDQETDKAALSAMNLRLAYIITGDTEKDRMSERGLVGLTNALIRRTAVEPAYPIGLDPENDLFLFYPMIYWPVLTDDTVNLSPQAIKRIQTYLDDGGTILFDTQLELNSGKPTRVAQSPELKSQLALRELLDNLDLPSLSMLDRAHILTRSFYLIEDYPGRFKHGHVWIEQTSSNPWGDETSVRDGVSSVVIGSNDWAAAWAVDDKGYPMAALIPGGGDQREHAFRFGINLVMYALTGNYKADQVHAPAILERLGQ